MCDGWNAAMRKVRPHSLLALLLAQNFSCLPSPHRRNRLFSAPPAHSAVPRKLIGCTYPLFHPTQHHAERNAYNAGPAASAIIRRKVLIRPEC